ncbi:MAG: energy transducer TonB [Bacteroidetes bacterium]|nr:energy transducer TonB [Bacteroidota bacterium]
MKTIFKLPFLLTLLLCNVCLININFSATLEASETEYLTFTEKMPEPIGGLESIIKKIVYPDTARKLMIEGKVYIMCFVDEKGIVTEAKIIKDVGGGCGEAAIDAIKKSKFTSGILKNTPVKVKMPIAIEFKLQ